MSGIVVLHLSAGQGPRECRWVVARLAEAFAAEAVTAGVDCRPVETTGDALPASLLLGIEGADAEDFVSERLGTILWVGTSPFRPNHKRRNWFVAVGRVPAPDAFPGFDARDIVYQTMRASGPGGQHVNTTDSAVRATHRPTGISTVSRDQRSQHANRKVALLKLALALDERREAAADAGRQAEWARNQSLERGNAVRTYVGPDFRLKR